MGYKSGTHCLGHLILILLAQNSYGNANFDKTLVNLFLHKKNLLRYLAQEDFQIKICFSKITALPIWFILKKENSVSQNSNGMGMQRLKVSFDRFLSSSEVNLKVAIIGL